MQPLADGSVIPVATFATGGDAELWLSKETARLRTLRCAALLVVPAVMLLIGGWVVYVWPLVLGSVLLANSFAIWGQFRNFQAVGKEECCCDAAEALRYLPRLQIAFAVAAACAIGCVVATNFDPSRLALRAALGDMLYYGMIAAVGAGAVSIVPLCLVEYIAIRRLSALARVPDGFQFAEVIPGIYPGGATVPGGTVLQVIPVVDTSSVDHPAPSDPAASVTGVQAANPFGLPPGPDWRSIVPPVSFRSILTSTGPVPALPMDGAARAAGPWQHQQRVFVLRHHQTQLWLPAHTDPPRS